MSQLQVTGEAKIRDIQGPVVANSGVITALDGAASQYVRGDGTLADFPTSTGGGSSVSYYLNSSVSQGTIGGVAYRELSKEPIIGAGTDITISANGYVASYITDANDPDVLSVPGGNFNCEFYFSVNNNTGNPTTYAELYKYDGTTFTLLGSSVAVPESLNQGTTIAPYYFAIPVATAALALTDRLAIRIYVNVDGRTVTLHTENSHLCQVVTTFSKGMVSLNNLTDQSQFITTGTSGTNFNIVSSGDTHTFNLPVASATNTGKLSSTDWSTFNAKQPAGNYVTLDTTQTITAEKTFSVSPISESGYSFKILASGTPFQNGYSLISSIEGSVSITQALSAGNLKAFTFDFSDWNINTTRTYTLPDASGTLALTSNLSSYVPYTGATANVDLGLFGLTSNAVKAIGDNSTYGGVISIKQNNVIGGLIGTGYTELFGKTNRLGISFGAGSIAYLSNSVLTAERTFTLPDLSGTLALLEGSQTFSGSKTFSFAPRNDGGILLKDNVTTGSSGYVSVGSNGSGITIGVHNSGTNYFHELLMPNSTSYNYTFPASSGTIALTSNLSAYLPLTGGTLTGNLTINPSTTDYTLTVSTSTTNNTIKLLGSTASNTSTIGYWSSNGGTGYGALNFTPTNTRFEIVNGGSFSIYTSGNERLTVASGGTTTLTGALSGTSATFSGNVLMGTATSNGARLEIKQANSLDYRGLLVVDSATPNWIGIAHTGTAGVISAWYDGAGTATPLIFKTGDTTRLTIASTGAATFSSSVTASNFLTNGAGGVGGQEALRINNDNGYIGFFNGANTTRSGYLQGNTTDVTLTTSPSTPLIFGTNNTERMRITSNGNVGIGTTSPASIGTGYTLLDVRGSSGGAIRFGVLSAENGLIYADAGQTSLRAVSNIPLTFATNDTERMRITSGGNVLIGTTTDAGYKLDVNGTGRFSGSLTSTAQNSFFGQSSSADSNIYIQAGYDGSNKFVTQLRSDYFGAFSIGTTLMPPANSPNTGTYTSRLSFALSGAATFSSSVTLNSEVRVKTATTSGVGLSKDSSGAYLYNIDNTFMAFGTNDTERMRITSGGQVMIRTTSALSPGGVSGVANILNPDDNGQWALALQNNATTNTFGRGLGIRINTVFNNSFNEMLYCADSLNSRFFVMSNGGIYNYQANNVNLSDINTKKDIIPLESYWDKFKAIEIVKFKYKDQTHDDFNIGVIAQQVEKFAPEFIDTSMQKIDGCEKETKAVYTSDLHHATIKVLQEAMDKIEQLEARIKQLENK